MQCLVLLLLYQGCGALLGAVGVVVWDTKKKNYRERPTRSGGKPRPARRLALDLYLGAGAMPLPSGATRGGCLEGRGFGRSGALQPEVGSARLWPRLPWSDGGAAPPVTLPTRRRYGCVMITLI